MYGITLEDIETINKKIEFQKSYLENFNLDISDKFVNMLENTYSANLNPKKYFAEINNRVNTMVSNAKDQGLKPIFITITAPSNYHRKYDNGDLHINPNDTAKDLTQIWNKFTNLQVFQKMKKELNISLTYFRVYEPHKSGVPHLHALLFLPPEYILRVKKKFYEYFTDKSKWGANIGGVGFRYTWYKEKGGAVGYVMKYILKTFKDTNSTAVQHAVYWYIKYNVRRFLSSRTLVPLSVYRKVRYYFKEHHGIDNLKVITQLFKTGQIQRYFNNTLITYMFYDEDLGDIKEVILWSKDGDLILNSRIHTKSDTIKLKYIKKENSKVNIVTFDNVDTFVFSEIQNKYIEIIKIPSKLTNYQLINYYRDLENTPLHKLNLQHFILTKNEMINRELLIGEIQSLNVDIF